LADAIISSVVPKGTIFHMDYEDIFKLKLKKPNKEKSVENE
jgi:hypothetical protein